jgi:hypothetical protein
MSPIVSASQRCSVVTVSRMLMSPVGLMWAGRQGQGGQLLKSGLSREGAWSEAADSWFAGKETARSDRNFENPASMSNRLLFSN